MGKCWRIVMFRTRGFVRLSKEFVGLSRELNVFPVYSSDHLTSKDSISIQISLDIFLKIMCDPSSKIQFHTTNILPRHKSKNRIPLRQSRLNPFAISYLGKWYIEFSCSISIFPIHPYSRRQWCQPRFNSITLSDFLAGRKLFNISIQICRHQKENFHPKKWKKWKNGKT